VISSKDYKAGLFVLFTLLLLGFMIVKVSQGGFLFSSSYNLYVTVNSAMGLSHKTPVQIAGVPVGVVTEIHLDKNNHARLKLQIQGAVRVDQGSVAQLKTTGILGDAFIELLQPAVQTQPLLDGGEIGTVQTMGDFGSLTDVMGQIAEDVKAITAQMRKNMAGDGSSFDNTMKNMEKITAYLAKNENNVNVSMNNIKAITENLNAILATNRAQINTTTSNVAEITTNMKNGEGTIGKLLKSEETLDKIHDSLDNINNLVGGANRFEVRMGGHAEYLGGSDAYKNYVSLALQPRPDKYFLFEVVSDPDPSFTKVVEETKVTNGTSSSTITTEKSSKQLDDLLFSFQFAKKFEAFTMRGGLIESSGGVGLDYQVGPFTTEFSAFDFRTTNGQRPHLKLFNTAHLTKTFYLLGGLDDFINPNQDLDWFMGAGFSFTDEDVKSLFGLIGLSSGR